MSIQQEPVRIITLVKAILTILTALGVIVFTDAEVETILTAVGAAYAVYEVIAAAIIRSRVSPVGKEAQ